MAGNWVKMAPQLEHRPQFRVIASKLDLSDEDLMIALYRLADWFHRYSDYGQMKASDFGLLDRIIRRPGFSVVLREVGWVRVNANTMTLFGFTDASTVRKSLGKKVRDEVLGLGKCAACGSTQDLVVDHIVPLVRGGSSDRSNLQPLCSPCNRSKGRKLPSEWGGNHG